MVAQPYCANIGLENILMNLICQISNNIASYVHIRNVAT